MISCNDKCVSSRRRLWWKRSQTTRLPVVCSAATSWPLAQTEGLWHTVPRHSGKEGRLRSARCFISLIWTINVAVAYLQFLRFSLETVFVLLSFHDCGQNIYWCDHDVATRSFHILLSSRLLLRRPSAHVSHETVTVATVRCLLMEHTHTEQRLCVRCVSPL